MSSIPLISHHLFVAAVKEKSLVAAVSDRSDGLRAGPASQVREIPIECVGIERLLPVEVVSPFKSFSLPGSS